MNHNHTPILSAKGIPQTKGSNHKIKQKQNYLKKHDIINKTQEHNAKVWAHNLSAINQSINGL